MKVPQDAEGLLRLMDIGGGLERELTHPLYSEKLSGIDLEVIMGIGWPRPGRSRRSGTPATTRSTGSGSPRGWRASTAPSGCSPSQGRRDGGLKELYTGGLSFEVAEDFTGGTPAGWKEAELSDAVDCLRLKLLDMLGSEGPRTLEAIAERLPFPKAQVDAALQEGSRYGTSSPSASSRRPRRGSTYSGSTSTGSPAAS